MPGRTHESPTRQPCHPPRFIIAAMINKIVPSIEQALAGTPDGAVVAIGGFGTAGIPAELIDGLIAQGYLLFKKSKKSKKSKNMSLRLFILLFQIF